MRRQPMTKVVDTVVDSGVSGDNQKNLSIGDRVKAARTALGLTQDGLARAVGGSKRGIQENEARNRVPGGDVVAGMVELGINANWLLTGEGPMMMADLTALPAKEIQRQSMQAGDGRQLMVMEQAAAFDARRDLLEAVLRVGEHKILHNQVTEHVIEFGLEGAPSWLESARDYPDLELRLRNMIATFKFLGAANRPD